MSEKRPLWIRGLLWLLGLCALGSFLLVLHNYGISLLPERQIVVPNAEMKPLPGEKSFAFYWDFAGMRGADELNPQSRARFSQDVYFYPTPQRNDNEVRLVGGDRWTVERKRIVFASTDNSDPRTNGLTYTLHVPRFYTVQIGRMGYGVFFVSVLGLYLLGRRPRESADPAPAEPGCETATAPAFRWKWPLFAAAAVFLLGLYFNTGTLAPYGNTYFPHVNKSTGYIYNTDHVHFHVLWDFINGADRKVWDHALLLRRIGFVVIAWPFMKVGGFEVGGTVASLVFNLAAFVASVHLIGRRFGPRAAAFAAWLLALYPGAAYWGGLPYSYSLICPTSMLLLLGVLELVDAPFKKVLWLSPVLGLAYLAYDLPPFFIPVTFLVLAWHRRFGAAVLSVVLQALPLAIWVAILTYQFKQPLENSNTSAYRTILTAFQSIKDVHAWWSTVSRFDDIGMDVFFGANFIFLPALFLAILALNAVTSRVRFLPVELTLILVTLGIFLFSNLAPFYGGSWNLRGTWISRLYQPVFPAFILFAARWWANLPPLRWPARSFIWLVCAAAFFGNALILFGPILNNPQKVSEFAYYKFYNHTDAHFIYEACLRDYGRRPLGFPRPQP